MCSGSMPMVRMVPAASWQVSLGCEPEDVAPVAAAPTAARFAASARMRCASCAPTPTASCRAECDIGCPVPDAPGLDGGWAGGEGVVPGWDGEDGLRGGGPSRWCPGSPGDVGVATGRMGGARGTSAFAASTSRTRSWGEGRSSPLADPATRHAASPMTRNRDTLDLAPIVVRSGISMTLAPSPCHAFPISAFRTNAAGFPSRGRASASRPGERSWGEWRATRNGGRSRDSGSRCRPA